MIDPQWRELEIARAIEQYKAQVSQYKAQFASEQIKPKPDRLLVALVQVLPGAEAIAMRYALDQDYEKLRTELEQYLRNTRR